MLSVTKILSNSFEWLFDQPITGPATPPGVGLQVKDTAGTWHDPATVTEESPGDLVCAYPFGATYPATASWQTSAGASSYLPSPGILEGQTGSA